MANLKNFLFNSDYSTDKIAYTKKDTYKITGSPSLTPRYIFLNTHIATQLYAEGDYKIDGTDDVYPMGTWGSVIVPVACVSFMYNGECWLAIGVYAVDSSAINKTIEYRIWAYYGEKDAKNVDMPATVNTNQTRLALNSDENYPRFITDVEIAVGQTYTHSLGYIPYVKVWSKVSNEDVPKPDGGSGTIRTDTYASTPYAYFGDATSDAFSAYEVQVSDSTIKTYAGHGGYEPDHQYFRIYAL